MNKYLHLINVDHIEVDQEYTKLSSLLMSVGLPRYNGQLEMWKQTQALQMALATKGLSFKRLSDKSFKVAIITL